MSNKFWTPELWCDFLNRNPSLPPTLQNEVNLFKASKEPKRDWEVVAYQSGSGKIFPLRNMDGSGRIWADDKVAYIDSVPTPRIPIHSVRRLSDGEIFSVGDRIISPLRPDGVAIDRFEIRESTLFIHHDKGHLYADGRHYYFGQIKKLPSPILVTVDGVEYFEGMNFRPTVVFDDWSMNANCDEGLWRNGLGLYPTSKIFSTREAAEAYITDNKPCLSIKEVRECMPRYLSTGEVKSILDKASKIVKSKLND